MKIKLILLFAFIFLFFNILIFFNYDNSENLKFIIHNQSNQITNKTELNNSKTVLINKQFNDFKLDLQKTIIVRTPENFVKESSAKEHLDRFKKNNVTKIILLVKNDEDLVHMDSGEVFYKSSIAPIAIDYKKFNFDALEYTISYAHKNNIEVYAWVPQFHDKIIINKNPDLQMRTLKNNEIIFYNENNEFFANPLSKEVKEYQKSIIEEIVTNYEIDGIYLDWIRFDNYEMDLSDTSIEMFAERYHYSPLEIDFTTDNPKRKDWNEFREDEIADYIKDISSLIKKINYNLTIGVFILPVEMKEVAQNPSKFKQYIDEIGVMLYNDDWGYSKSWIYKNALEDLKHMVNNDSKIIPVLDTHNCHDIKLIKIIIDKGVNYPYCFEYWDWTTDKLDFSY